nr:putative ribonuclease H-like domain-containing protein [Tanacetum cinerariifolium]
MVEEQSFMATIHQKIDPALLQFCLYSCFLSQVEPKRVSDALQDPSWVEAIQEELLQFKIEKVWTLVDCPKGVRPIGTKWVLKNKKDERELRKDMKCWEELVRANVFRLGGHRDHLSASLAHMLYCIVFREQYNLAYFFVKRNECARATPNAKLLYGMVMRPLALKQTRKPQSDREMHKARHSVSSSFAHHYGSSSHHGDDDKDDDASRASTPSPTTYLNSLLPFNYQKYDTPTSSQKDDDLLFE